MFTADEVIAAIRKCLKQYLQDAGTRIPDRGNFPCPIPDCNHRHGDRNPSASFPPGSDETFVHCFSSGKNYDIFHIFGTRERLPLQGPGFWDVTLPALAEACGFEYEATILNEEQRARYMRFRAYRDVAFYISTYPNKHSEELITTRGWSVQTCKHLLIGSVDSFDIYTAEMERLGWDQSYLKDIGLQNSEIFNESSLIFTICLPDGTPCAFVARNIEWESKNEKGEQAEKYRNSSSEVYSKSRTIYNFNNARRAPAGHDIWLFEGYGDCVTAYQNGLVGACSTGGTAITEEHLALLSTLEGRKINIAFDGDEEGINAVTRTIDKHFGEKIPLNFKIVLVPEKLDPDEYIRKYGVEPFYAIEKQTIFQWRLSQNDLPPEELADATIPTILHESDRVKRHFLARMLSDATGVNFRRILDEVERREQQQDFDKVARSEYLKNSVIRKLQTGEPLETVIFEAGIRIEELKKQSQPDEKVYVDGIDTIRAKFLQPYVGYAFGMSNNVPILPKIHRVLDGLPRYGSLTVFSGIPGSGKTSFMRFLFYNIAMANDDTHIVFMSIDDPKSKIFQSIVTLNQRIPLPKVRKYNTLSSPDREKWEAGWNHVKRIRERFRVFDSSQGTTISTMEQYIRSSQDLYPQKQTLLVLDNFHKLTDFAGQDEKSRHAYCVNMIKDISTKYDVPIFMTVELRKLATISAKPTMNDLKDTVEIAYDADMVWLLHNDFHINPDTTMKWESRVDDISEMRSCPIVEFSVVKNKETGWKGTVLLDFEDSLTTFAESSDQARRKARIDPTGTITDLRSRAATSGT